MLSSFWDGFLNFLNKDPQQTSILHSVLKQVKPIELKENEVVLDCDNQAVRLFLEKRSDEIEKSLFIHLNKKIKVGLVVIEKKRKREEPPLLSFKPSVNDLFFKSGLRAKYGFDNFAVSSSNQVAYAAAQAVAKNLGTAYNPLFLYGGVGVGKTHLAQAVGRRTIEQDPEKKVLFCPGDHFTNELIESIRERSTSRFRRKYRNLNLLIVDDVQFIGGKVAVQEEFFHTFNTVVSGGGQVILASDRPPGEIKNLEDRLRSRFLGGLMVDVQPPDFELRAAILLIKAREKNIEIDIEAAKIIAEQIIDTRGLEGALLSIYAKTLGQKEKVDIETVLGYFSDKTEVRIQKVEPSDIIKTVCSYYDIKQSRIKSPNRAESIAFPRQIVMYLLRKDLKLKLEEIAYILKKKDHTTIIHGVEKVEKLLLKDATFKQEIDKILQSLHPST